jgi:hypothetical protein
MEGFKPVIKMKTGGSVSKAIAAAEKKEMRSGMHEDIKEDKKLVKKAINLHDDQLHEGAKTDLKTLKKGGRTKKEVGTVRKYAAGGMIEAKGGKKPRPRPEPPGGVEPDDVPYAPTPAYKCGGKVKKMAVGGLTDPTTQAIVNADVLRRRKAGQLGAGAGAGGLGAPNAVPPAAMQAAGAAPAGGAMTPAGAPVMPQGVQTPGPVMKKGGKVKGCK